jgi:hypothetical protein
MQDEYSSFNCINQDFFHFPAGPGCRRGEGLAGRPAALPQMQGALFLRCGDMPVQGGRRFWDFVEIGKEMKLC